MVFSAHNRLSHLCSFHSPPFPWTLRLFWTDYNSTLTSNKLYASKVVRFALTLHPIKSPSVMVHVYLYLQQLRVQSLLQSELVHMARHLPAKANRFGNRDWLWYRVGLNPQSRHALVTWGYFNSSVLFSTCSHFPVSVLSLSHVAGVNVALEVLLSAMEADGCGPFSSPYWLNEGCSCPGRTFGPVPSYVLSGVP